MRAGRQIQNDRPADRHEYRNTSQPSRGPSILINNRSVLQFSIFVIHRELPGHKITRMSNVLRCGDELKIRAGDQ